jgi:hypothetical protein
MLVLALTGREKCSRASVASVGSAELTRNEID